MDSWSLVAGSCTLPPTGELVWPSLEDGETPEGEDSSEESSGDESATTEESDKEDSSEES